MSVFIQRVASEDNIADLPSRGARMYYYFFPTFCKHVCFSGVEIVEACWRRRSLASASKGLSKAW
eukprot:4596171-Karenia_brevis.AAC.1